MHFTDEDLAAVARRLPPPPVPANVESAHQLPRYSDFQDKHILARTHYSITSKAWDPVRKAFVVIKEIHSDRMLYRNAAEQFRAEFSRVAQLSGPNIVPPWFRIWIRNPISSRCLSLRESIWMTTAGPINSASNKQ